MAQLNQIQFTDPITAEQVRRLAQYVASALQDGFVEQAPVVSTLTATPTANAYAVAETDGYVAVNAAAGAFTVTLPKPAAKQVVTVV